MRIVRTVLGELPADELGVCDSHDHLFFRSRQLPGQELDDVEAAEQELRRFHELGGQSVVQWTPMGLGRRLDELPGLSRTTGITIIAATGLHRAEHYDPEYVAWCKPRLADLFVRDITERGAGVIKVAGAYHGLDQHATYVMTAAAHAHHKTGAPICVHLELGTAALDVLDLLCGRLSVPPERVILGHLNRFPDPWVHHRAAASGAFLGFDGPSRANHATDWRLVGSLIGLADAGHGRQILLGGDTTTAAARGMPGMGYLLTSLRPRLGTELARQVFVENPARAFGIDQ